MTEEEIKHTVRELRDRVDDLEQERERLAKLPDAVAELKGTVQTLSTLVVSRFDKVDVGVDKAASLKTAIQFAGVVLVPIILALIGGYVALKTGAGGGK